MSINRSTPQIDFSSWGKPDNCGYLAIDMSLFHFLSLISKGRDDPSSMIDICTCCLLLIDSTFSSSCNNFHSFIIPSLTRKAISNNTNDILIFMDGKPSCYLKGRSSHDCYSKHRTIHYFESTRFRCKEITKDSGMFVIMISHIILCILIIPFTKQISFLFFLMARTS